MRETRPTPTSDLPNFVSANDTPDKAPRIAKSSGELSPRLEMATTQLDPKQLARLIAQAATTGARSERPTEQIAPMDLQVLRDQALTELVDSELDPRVVRALLSAAPSVDPPRPTDDTAPAPGVTPVTPVAPAAIGLDPALPLEVRGRRRHVEIAPIRKPPPVAIPRHLAVAPSPISRQRAIVFAAAVITLVLVLVLAR